MTRLVSYSVEDVLSGGLVAEHNPKPILIGARTESVDRFIGENIIFLQPTRIISRKRIETSFNLLLKMFEEEEMVHEVQENFTHENDTVNYRTYCQRPLWLLQKISK